MESERREILPVSMCFLALAAQKSVFNHLKREKSDKLMLGTVLTLRHRVRFRGGGLEKCWCCSVVEVVDREISLCGKTERPAGLSEERTAEYRHVIHPDSEIGERRRETRRSKSSSSRILFTKL